VRYEHLRPLGNAKENRPLFAGSDLEVGREPYRASLRTPEARAALKQLTSWRQDHHVALLCFERVSRCTQDCATAGVVVCTIDRI